MNRGHDFWFIHVGLETHVKRVTPALNTKYGEVEDVRKGGIGQGKKKKKKKKKKKRNI